MASAQIKLPTRKMKFASRMIGFLPQISLILPHNGIQAAFASRYDEAIHEYPLSVAWKYAAMVGRAVEMMVYSAVSQRPKNRADDKSSYMQVVYNVPCPERQGKRPAAITVSGQLRNEPPLKNIHKEPT
jgi:hypothetical protein